MTAANRTVIVRLVHVVWLVDAVGGVVEMDWRNHSITCGSSALGFSFWLDMMRWSSSLCLCGGHKRWSLYTVMCAGHPESLNHCAIESRVACRLFSGELVSRESRFSWYSGGHNRNILSRMSLLISAVGNVMVVGGGRFC